MKLFLISMQMVVALTLLNVWLVRRKTTTPWRGGAARDMREEFFAYGLPAWSMTVVGCLKVALALVLVSGLWFPAVVRPAALGIAALMLGAIAMHFRIADPLRKSAPAAAVLTLSVLTAVASA